MAHRRKSAIVELHSVLRVLTQPELDREGVDFVFLKNGENHGNPCIKPRQLMEKTTATFGENHGNITLT